MAHVTLRPLKSGKISYQAVWHIIDPKTGKRIQQTKSFGKRADAKSHARLMEVEVEGKGVGDPDKHDLKRYLTRWQATLRHSGNYSPATMVGYTRWVRHLIRELGHIPLAKLTAADCDEAYGRLLTYGLSMTSVRHCHSVLHSALERARKWKLIGTNVVKDATPPTATKSTVRALTPDEVARVLAYSEPGRLRRSAYPGTDIYIRLALATGLRREEMLGLAFDRIDFDAGTVRVDRTVIHDETGAPILRDDKTKTQAGRRTVSITADLVERLRRHKAFIHEQKLKWGPEYSNELPLMVFPSAGGRLWDPNHATAKFQAMFRVLGIKGVQRTHVFRHSHASWLMASGMNPKAVSQRIGHGNVAFTLSTYTHPDRAEDEKAAETMEALLRAAQSTAKQEGNK